MDTTAEVAKPEATASAPVAPAPPVESGLPDANHVPARLAEVLDPQIVEKSAEQVAREYKERLNAYNRDFKGLVNGDIPPNRDTLSAYAQKAMMLGASNTTIGRRADGPQIITGLYPELALFAQSKDFSRSSLREGDTLTTHGVILDFIINPPATGPMREGVLHHAVEPFQRELWNEERSLQTDKSREALTEGQRLQDQRSIESHQRNIAATTSVLEMIGQLARAPVAGETAQPVAPAAPASTV